jgi:hypothetical protein
LQVAEPKNRPASALYKPVGKRGKPFAWFSCPGLFAPLYGAFLRIVLNLKQGQSRNLAPSRLSEPWYKPIKEQNNGHRRSDKLN